MQDIVKWTKGRRRYWNEHVKRANSEGLIKIAQGGRPAAKRPRGRPPKRWKESWASSSTETRGGCRRTGDKPIIKRKKKKKKIANI